MFLRRTVLLAALAVCLLGCVENTANITQDRSDRVAKYILKQPPKNIQHRVNVKLETENGLLVLGIADDGNGFNAFDLTEVEGLGLAGMRERAGLVGGVLEVYSQPQKGTRIYFKVPVDGSAKV